MTDRRTDDAQDLPDLTGARAEIVQLGQEERTKLLRQLEERIRSTAGGRPAGAVDQLVDLYRTVALRHTAASWWLNYVDRPFALAGDLQRAFNADDKAKLAAMRDA